MAKVNTDVLKRLYILSCESELQAIKPGNVGVYSTRGDMVAEDFALSARASAEPLVDTGYCLGERIFRAIEATRQVVDCNTNLGIVLLCAPVMQALITRGKPLTPETLNEVLQSTTVVDADWVYRAIRLAEPGGMGKVEQHDVNDIPGVNLLTAMQQAAERDRIAWQYAHDYQDIFNYAVPRLIKYRKKWNSEPWAITAVFMGLLSRFPDSLIARKYGDSRAGEISVIIARLEEELSRSALPDSLTQRLLDLDVEFKRTGINPGTTADLTVASILVAHLMEFFGTDITEVSAFFSNQGEELRV